MALSSIDERENGTSIEHSGVESLARELGLLRKTVLRQGHAQELFQARIEEAVGRLAGGEEEKPPVSQGSAGLTSTQVRVLLELDQAVLQLLRLASGEIAGESEPAEDAPHSLREGLSLLQVRVRNLKHSMGLEPIPALHRPFDDRWHEACGVAHRPDLPDGWIAEEILPGYRLGERVVRPARVVVNRLSS
jgi:hypothetical protein